MEESHPHCFSCLLFMETILLHEVLDSQGNIITMCNCEMVAVFSLFPSQHVERVMEKLKCVFSQRCSYALIRGFFPLAQCPEHIIRPYAVLIKFCHSLNQAPNHDCTC